MIRASQFLRNVTSNYVVVGVDALIFILLTPIVVRSLGLELYAVWVIMQTIAYYLDYLDAGVPDAQIRQHAILVARRDSRGLSALQGTVFVLYLAAGLVAIVLTAALSALPLRDWLDIPSSADAAFVPTLLLFGLATLLGFLEGGLDNVFEGYQRFDLMNGVHIALQVISALATVAALTMGYGLVALAAIICLDSLLGSVIKASIIRRVFPEEAQPNLAFSKESWASIKEYSLWNSLNEFMTEGTAQLDRILIPVLLASALVAPYSLVVALSAAVFLLAEPITDTFLPIAAERHDRNDRRGLGTFLLRGTKLVTLATLPVAVVIAVYGEAILNLWIGSEYTDISVTVLWFTVANFFFSTYLWTALNLLMGAGEFRRIFWISAFEIVLVVMLILALVPSMSLPGLALAGLLANVATGVTLFIPAACRRTTLRPASFIFDTLFPKLVAALPGLGLGVWLAGRVELDTWMNALAASAASGSVTMLSLLAFGTTRRERQRYYITIRRLVRG